MENITIQSIPQTIEEFISLRNNIATSPEGGAAIFVIALKLYVENPSIGNQALVIAANNKMLSPGNVYKGFAINAFTMQRLKEQMRRYPYLPNSYFAGTSPENGYKFSCPANMEISDNSHSGNKESGDYKVFVRSYGADSPRPISMIRNNKGLWKANEWSSIIMGIRPPIEIIDDDL